MQTTFIIMSMHILCMYEYNQFQYFRRIQDLNVKSHSICGSNTIRFTNFCNNYVHNFVLHSDSEYQILFHHICKS